MGSDREFVDYLRELFAPAGHVGVRRMFGGDGFYIDGLFCALAWDGQLFLKVDDTTRATFVAAGCAPFVYLGQEQPVEMSYWTVPEAALESAEDMAPWLRMAVEAAGRKVAKKSAARKPAAKKRGSKG
jgi:DNA transformation protein